ncbi:MAG: glycosyltransferase family 39 protein [bacterium]|nr:glycosyltransferase family 39 protein [bacterium]
MGKGKLFFLFVLAILVWLLFFWLHPDYASTEDASLYAGIARNIINKNGPYMSAITPVFFTYNIPTLSFGWPSFYNYLHPLTVAISFLILGPSHFSLVLTNAFFYVMTLPLVFLLAKKLYNTQTAFWAGVWYIFSLPILNSSISGMTEPLFSFLVTLVFFLLFVFPKHFFWVGLTVALAYLTRFQGILLIPPLLIYIATLKKKFLYGLLFLSGFASIIFLSKLFLPLMAQDYARFDNNYLWYAMAADALRPSSEIFGTLSVVTFSDILTNFNLILFKALTNLYFFTQKLFAVLPAPIVIFYALSFFQFRSLKKNRTFKFLSLNLILVFLVFHLFVLFDLRFFFPLLPLLTVAAAATFLSLLEKLNPKRILFGASLFTAFFIVIPTFASSGTATALQRTLAKPRRPTIVYLLARLAKENTSSKAIIVSDRAAHLSWYGERRTIFLPPNPAYLSELEKKVPIDALFFSNYFPEHYPAWQDLVENPHDFGDFTFVKSFEIKPEENYYRIPIKAVLYFKKR